MGVLIGLALDGIVNLPSWSPLTVGETLSVLLGTLAALAALVVRYRYSTRSAAFYLSGVMLMALSPLATRVLSVHPWYFLGGFLVVQTTGLAVDYLYTAITGETTGVAAFRAVAAKWIDRLRDRRRKVRRRLEAILDRKTIIAVLVGMPLSEFVKVTVIQMFAAAPIKWHLAWAHMALVIFGLGIGIHWEQIKEAAHDAGEQAEEMVDDNDG